jgi:2'-5' RNA ligase
LESFFDQSAGRPQETKEDYRWYIRPPAQWAEQHLYEPYRELIDRPGLMRVPVELAHITLLNYARVDEASDGTISKVVDQVRVRCAAARPLSVRIRRAELWQSSVVCPVYPAQILRELCEIISEAAAEAAGPREHASLEFFHPHLMVAFCTSPLPNSPLRSWLCDHDVPEPELAVDRVALVRQRQAGTEITCTDVAVIPLGRP